MSPMTPAAFHLLLVLAAAGAAAPAATDASTGARASCVLPAKAAPSGPSNRRNLEAMIARPDDLCGGRGTETAPAAPLAVLVGRYLNPEVGTAGANGPAAQARDGAGAKR